jgi:hypothetical protein
LKVCDHVIFLTSAVTEVDNSPLPVAVNVAVPVAELRAIKYATPPEKSLAPSAVVIAVVLVDSRKLTVEVVEARVIDSPLPSEAGAPAASVSLAPSRPMTL